MSFLRDLARPCQGAGHDLFGWKRFAVSDGARPGAGGWFCVRVERVWQRAGGPTRAPAGRLSRRGVRRRGGARPRGAAARARSADHGGARSVDTRHAWTLRSAADGRRRAARHRAACVRNGVHRARFHGSGRRPHLRPQRSGGPMQPCAISRGPCAHSRRVDVWELLVTRRSIHRLTAHAFLLALVASCSARQDAQSPPKYEATATTDAGQASPHQQQYPQQYGVPSFALPPPTDLAGNEAALDVYERELSAALDPNAPVPLSEGDRCAIVCRALQSMRQSAEHICGLAQDRCEAARERVRKAEERAKDACPACATPT